jgi:hypothetical protein
VVWRLASSCRTRGLLAVCQAGDKVRADQIPTILAVQTEEEQAVKVKAVLEIQEMVG